MASTTLVVHEGEMINHSGEFGVLGIATGNYASEKYLNEKGEETREPTAGLWLVLRGRPETNAFQRANSGRQIEYLPFRIKVLTIGSDRRGMYVRVEVSEPGGGANASGKNN
jgi:hypothetical protein